MIEQETSLVAASKDFFGLKDGQNNMAFMQEFKQLNDADRVEIKIGLREQGYKIKD